MQAYLQAFPSKSKYRGSFSLSCGATSSGKGCNSKMQVSSVMLSIRQFITDVEKVEP
jgi:hypothetical protein